MQSLPLDPSTNKKNGKVYNPLQWALTSHCTFSKNSIDRYIIKLIIHTIEIKKIWATFNYHSPQISKVTNLFRNTKMGRAFKATATLQQLIRPIAQNPKPDYEKSGIYKITCKTCNKSYVGQTSRILKLRFQEHTRCIKNNDPRSSYAIHTLNCRHKYRNINDNLTLLKRVNKPSLLLPYEQMYINHSTTIVNLSLNTIPTNVIPCLNSSTRKLLTSQTSRTPNQLPLSHSQFSLNLCTDQTPRPLQRTILHFL
jgi:hypothetical protein